MTDITSTPTTAATVPDADGVSPNYLDQRGLEIGAYVTKLARLINQDDPGICWNAYFLIDVLWRLNADKEVLHCLFAIVSRLPGLQQRPSGELFFAEKGLAYQQLRHYQQAYNRLTK